MIYLKKYLQMDKLLTSVGRAKMNVKKFYLKTIQSVQPHFTLSRPVSLKHSNEIVISLIPSYLPNATLAQICWAVKLVVILRLQQVVQREKSSFDP